MFYHLTMYVNDEFKRLNKNVRNFISVVLYSPHRFDFFFEENLFLTENYLVICRPLLFLLLLQQMIQYHLLCKSPQAKPLTRLHRSWTFQMTPDFVGN